MVSKLFEFMNAVIFDISWYVKFYSQIIKNETAEVGIAFFTRICRYLIWDFKFYTKHLNNIYDQIGGGCIVLWPVSVFWLN